MGIKSPSCSWVEGEYSIFSYCERCDKAPSKTVYLLGRFPTALCNKCRRDMEILLADSKDYKALLAVVQNPPRIPGDMVGFQDLTKDISLNIYDEILKGWLEDGKESG